MRGSDAVAPPFAPRHTPGPWIAADGPSSVVGWPVVSQAGRSICRLTWFERASPAGEAEETKEETRANAHLIAATPDLYEALKAMFDRWEPDPEPYADRRMWEAARDALNKAEGRPE